jgi:hypothetical protein
MGLRERLQATHHNRRTHAHEKYNRPLKTILVTPCKNQEKKKKKEHA